MNKVNYRFILFLCVGLTCSIFSLASDEQRRCHVKGTVIDTQGNALVGASVYLKGTNKGTFTDDHGFYRMTLVPGKPATIVVSFVGYVSQTKLIEPPVEGQEVSFTLLEDAKVLSDVEVFGERGKQPEKLSLITRMPLRPSEQIQSISVLSNRLIEEQGSLTITDAVQNVVGVTQFANYGGVQESLSARGYRGLPVLKNGVRVQSDFRGTGFITDMQGIESIQVLKGSAALTQGVGNDLGSAGGVINLATKTPKFMQTGVLSLRGGSWGSIRPTFDVQTILDRHQRIAVRLNGAYERADSYRKGVSKDRIYLNPSIAWRPNRKTEFTAEFDYLHDSRTPDNGTVNLAADSIKALYDMPNSRFLGFKSDRNITDNLTYSFRGSYQLTEQFSLRAAFMGSTLEVDRLGASNRVFNRGKEGYNMRQRSLGRSERKDKNSTLQLDLIGKDVYTGFIKHTFQVGMDYQTNNLQTTSYTSVQTDVIDVLKDVPNELPDPKIELVKNAPRRSKEYSYGLMAQNVMSFTDYVKAVLGLRYSSTTSSEEKGVQSVRGNAWNPMVGIIVSPIKQLNIFGSFTTTTSLRSAANKMEDGSLIGASRSSQFEVGIKSDWINNRLRFNFTYFNILNKNLAYSIYDESFQPTGLYAKAGNLRRQGIETELLGRIMPNLEVIIGYAYLKAEYKDSPAYHEGSAPLNTPSHTGNGWVYYTFDRGLFKDLSLGVGVYYVGKRPVNDYTIKVTHTNTQANVKPFDMSSYTTVNAQIGYEFKKVKLQLFFNNIFDKLGYTSYYRGGFINPIDPFNFSAALSYKF